MHAVMCHMHVSLNCITPAARRAPSACFWGRGGGGPTGEFPVHSAIGRAINQVQQNKRAALSQDQGCFQRRGPVQGVGLRLDQTYDDYMVNKTLTKALKGRDMVMDNCTAAKNGRPVRARGLHASSAADFRFDKNGEQVSVQQCGPLAALYQPLPSCSCAPVNASTSM